MQTFAARNFNAASGWFEAFERAIEVARYERW